MSMHDNKATVHSLQVLAKLPKSKGFFVEDSKAVRDECSNETLLQSSAELWFGRVCRKKLLNELCRDSIMRFLHRAIFFRVRCKMK
ncbi:hypothetical protein DIE17_03990 [Burkholderia sp. Bp9099]|nr:hypothetical protein DIE17_03990 [Burkholderia sp. Bp9099]